MGLCVYGVVDTADCMHATSHTMHPLMDLPLSHNTHNPPKKHKHKPQTTTGLLRTELEGVIQHDVADAYHTHKDAFTAPDVLRLVAWSVASQGLVASKVG